MSFDDEKKVDLSQHLSPVPAEEYHEGDDYAKKILATAGSQAPITPEEEKALVRKIDFWLMPVMFVVFGLQYADKSAVGAAALFGMVQELGLFRLVSLSPLIVDTGLYSNIVMIFFVGYLVGTFPLAFVAQRYPIGRVCAVYVVVWGAIATVTPACTNYNGIMAQRFMLGVAESGVSPAFLQIIGMWYTQKEQALRMPFVISSAGFLIVVFLGMTYGIVQLGVPIHSWVNIFFLIGGITTAFGFVVYFILPDSPFSARFLNERERYVACERLRINQAGMTVKVFRKAQAIEALKDIKTWLLFAISFCVSAPNGAAGNFSTLVIQQVYGANNYRTLLLSMPSGTIAGICAVSSGYFSSRIPNTRAVFLIFFACTTIIGCALEWQMPLSNKAALLTGVYMLVTFAGSFAIIGAWAVSNTAGATKKTVVGSLVYAAQSLSGIASPFFFRAREAPRYPTGFAATMACMAAAVGLTLVYVGIIKRENDKRNLLPPPERDMAFDDLTDNENKAFRYAL